MWPREAGAHFRLRLLLVLLLRRGAAPSVDASRSLPSHCYVEATTHKVLFKQKRFSWGWDGHAQLHRESHENVFNSGNLDGRRRMW